MIYTEMASVEIPAPQNSEGSEEDGRELSKWRGHWIFLSSTAGEQPQLRGSLEERSEKRSLTTCFSAAERDP